MPLFVLAVVASTPFYANLFAVQFNLVVLCCCAGALLAASRGYSGLAGLLLAAACWMKIYPGILLLVMLSLRTFRPTAFKAMLIGATLPVLLLPVIPSSLYFDYFLDALPHLSGQSLINLDNQSITAALGRLSFPIEQWPGYQIVQTTLPIRLVNLTAALLLVGLMVWRGATVRAADHDQEVSIALWLVCRCFRRRVGAMRSSSRCHWSHFWRCSIPTQLCEYSRCCAGWRCLCPRRTCSGGWSNFRWQPAHWFIRAMCLPFRRLSY